jgi:hypothetical protein
MRAHHPTRGAQQIAEAQRVDDLGRPQITVLIDSAEPFRGTIVEPGRPDRDFTGWTAFGGLVDEALQRLEREGPERM